jgi:hypothetical protein
MPSHHAGSDHLAIRALKSNCVVSLYWTRSCFERSCTDRSSRECSAQIAYSSVGTISTKLATGLYKKDSSLANQVLRIFIDEIAKQLRKCCDGITADAKLGAVSFIQ